MYPVYTINELYNISHNTYVSLAAHHKLLQGQTALQDARYPTYSQNAIATYIPMYRLIQQSVYLAIYCACLTPFIHCPGSCTP